MTTRRVHAAVVAAAACFALVPITSVWAQTTSTTSTTTSSTTTSTSTTVPGWHPCTGDLREVVLPNGSVECRRPDGSLACLLPPNFPSTCPPPNLPVPGPGNTSPNANVGVVISTAGDPPPATPARLNLTG